MSVRLAHAGAAQKAWQPRDPLQYGQLELTLMNLNLPVMLLAGQVLQLPIHSEKA